MELRMQTHLFFALWTCVFLFSGCGTYPVEEESETVETVDSCEMDVTLSNASLFTSLYPLHLYLFDTKGESVWEEEIQNQAEWPVLSQIAGDYVLTVISGLSSEDYLPPMSLNSRQMLTFAQGNYAHTPLVMGKNSVRLRNDVRVSVSLSYAVAALYLSFEGIPDEAVEVEARISPVSSGITFEGNRSNDGQFASVVCQKEKNVWKAGPIYILPSESTQTHLSLNVKTETEETVYGYFFNYPLEAGRPYRFVSTGKGEITLEGNAAVQDWVTETFEEFPFEHMTQEDDWDQPEVEVPGEEEDEPNDAPEEEEGGNEDTNEDNEDSEVNTGDTNEAGTASGDSDVLVSEELPESDSIWGPFFVWKVEAVSASEVIATLVSPRQWLLKKAEAIQVCEAYEVDGITGWRTFTTEEAKEFRDQYDDTILTLSDMLWDNGLDRFNKYDCRYLCNDFHSTFCFYNTKILNSGETVEYALRLVKQVRIEKAK